MEAKFDSAKCLFKRPRGLLLHVRHEVRVDVKGDAYGSVAQHLGHDFRVDVLREQEGSARVPEVVEPYRPQPRELQERLEGPIAEVRGVDEGSGLSGEDKTAGPVEGAHPLHLLELA